MDSIWGQVEAVPGIKRGAAGCERERLLLRGCGRWSVCRLL